MAFDRDKFKSLVHYVCWRCKDDPSRLGAVKLNKVLWMADFTAYYNSGEPITGARYIKRKFGPVPSSILPTLAELESDGTIFSKEVHFHRLKKREFKVFADPDLTVFNEEELRVADRAIRYVCDEHTAKSISERSHDHIWHAAEDGEEIPYYTVFAQPGEIGEDERQWARQELEELAA